MLGRVVVEAQAAVIPNAVGLPVAALPQRVGGRSRKAQPAPFEVVGLVPAARTGGGSEPQIYCFFLFSFFFLCVFIIWRGSGVKLLENL